MADLTEAQASANLAALTVSFDESRLGNFAVLPHGFSVTSLEQFQAAPNRISAKHVFVDVESLADYLVNFQTGGTMVCADYAAATITAQIDGDMRGQPSHKEHSAAFRAVIHDTAKAWLGICGKAMSQVAFGLFLEDRAVDVVSPAAADVMEMVMKFDAIKKVTFKSSTRLHDGNRQFEYVEDTQVRGAISLPDHFIVLSPVYRGLEPQRIKFMVRYRIEDGTLRFQVDMHDKETVMRAAFDKCVDALKASMSPGTPVFITG